MITSMEDFLLREHSQIATKLQVIMQIMSAITSVMQRLVTRSGTRLLSICLINSELEPE